MSIIFMLWNFSFRIGYYKALKDKESQTLSKIFLSVSELYQFLSACVWHGVQRLMFKHVK